VGDLIVPQFDHIVRINRTMIARYGGVGHHVLNGGPLHNALNLIAGPLFDHDQFPTIPEKACKIASAVATGHVFSDGNKRTAVSSLDLMLNLNGHALHAPEDDLVDTMYALASGTLTYEELVVWATAHTFA
jgi:death on curing protein